MILNPRELAKIHPIRFKPAAKTIAVTGGPAGGKTTVLTAARQRLEDMGVFVGTIPELATEYITGGFIPGKTVPPDIFQESILLGMIEREQHIHRMAESVGHPQTVILSDRGRLDGSAYMDTEGFFDMALRYGYEPADLSEKAYSAVIHLRSTAVDLPDLYSTANNSARRETVEEARKQDQLTERAWQSHPHFRVIPNVDLEGNPMTLEQKTRLFIREVAHILGIPVPTEIERKFRMKKMADLSSVFVTDVDITQYYLSNHEAEERVRQRAWRNSPVYYHAIKREFLPGKRSENEDIVSAVEFVSFLKRMKPDTNPISKMRHTFVWKNQYFEFDRFRAFHEGLFLFEVELTELTDKLILPPFLEDSEEVTGDKRFSNAALAAAKDTYWLN